MTNKSYKSLVLHIGYPKTATTFLQEKVFSQLIQYGYYAPSKRIAHLSLEQAVSSGHLLFGKGLSALTCRHYSFSNIYAEKYLSNLMDNTDCSSLLLSAEGTLDPNIFKDRSHSSNSSKNLASILQSLRSIYLAAMRMGFQYFKVIVTIRAQQTLLSSLYSQNSDRILIASQSDYEHKLINMFNISTLKYIDAVWFDYLNLHSELSNLFGEENILIIPQEAMQRSLNLQLSLLYDHLGITPLSSDQILSNAPLINARKLGEKQWKLRKYNLFPNKLSLGLPRLCGNSIKLTKLVERLVMLEYSDSNYHLSAKLNTDLSSLGYFCKG